MSKGYKVKKKSTQERKAQVNFDLNVPGCITCPHYIPPIHGVPGKTGYVMPLCIKHGWHVKPRSICDDHPEIIPIGVNRDLQVQT